jgi:hypothetical protein
MSTEKRTEMSHDSAPAWFCPNGQIDYGLAGGYIQVALASSLPAAQGICELAVERSSDLM